MHPRAASRLDHGADLPILGAAADGILRAEAGGRTGGGRSARLSVATGGEGSGFRGDAAAGAECRRVSLARGLSEKSGRLRGLRARAAAPERAFRAFAGGMRAPVRTLGRDDPADGGIDVRGRVAAVGAVAAEGQGRGSGTVAAFGPRGQGQQGPPDDGAAFAGPAAAGTSRPRVGAVPGGPRSQAPGGGFAGGAGAQMADGRGKVRVVLVLSLVHLDDGPPERDRAPAPRAGRDIPEGDPAGRGPCQIVQTGDAAHAAAQFRDAFAGGRDRHPRFAGSAGAFGHLDDGDLSAHGEADRRGHPQPAGLRGGGESATRGGDARGRRSEVRGRRSAED